MPLFEGKHYVVDCQGLHTGDFQSYLIEYVPKTFMRTVAQLSISSAGAYAIIIIIIIAGLVHNRVRTLKMSPVACMI